MTDIFCLRRYLILSLFDQGFATSLTTSQFVFHLGFNPFRGHRLSVTSTCNFVSTVSAVVPDTNIDVILSLFRVTLIKHPELIYLPLSKFNVTHAVTTTTIKMYCICFLCVV